MSVKDNCVNSPPVDMRNDNNLLMINSYVRVQQLEYKADDAKKYIMYKETAWPTYAFM